MITSETIGALAPALVAASAEMPTVEKASVANTGKFSYRYADLAEVLRAVRPILAKHGLAIVQGVGDDGIETRIVHTSGEWIASTTPMPSVESGRLTGAQAVGATITYMRRYALGALLSLATDEDTDAQHVETAKPAQRHADPKQPPTIDTQAIEAEAAELAEMDVLDMAEKQLGKAIGYEGTEDQLEEARAIYRSNAGTNRHAALTSLLLRVRGKPQEEDNAVF